MNTSNRKKHTALKIIILLSVIGVNIFPIVMFAVDGSDHSQDQSAAQQQPLPAKAPTVTTSTAGGENKINRMEVGCSWTDVTSAFMPCVAQLPYYLLYLPASQALIYSGMIFDKTIGISLDNKYLEASFVTDAWTIIRDLSNMVFIFILLYTGILSMFGQGEWGKTVLNVVIIAIFINFSLFATKIVIDAGNILAVGVYEAIGASDGEGGRNISAALAQNFQPEKFLSKSVEVDAMRAAGIYIIAAIVNIFAAYIFFKVALLFIGRLLAFWFLMIFSPYAFITYASPKSMGWTLKEWINLLIEQSFVAPVFLFLIYLLMQVINSDLFTDFSNVTGAGGSNISGSDNLDLFSSILITALLLTALNKILEITTTLSGKFGSTTSEYAGKALGMGMGATARLGRSSGGAIAQYLEDGGALKRLATSDNAAGRFFGRHAMTLNESARTGSWDLRGTGIGKTVGIDFGNVSKNAMSGYAGAQERQDKKDKAFAKKLKMSPEEKAIALEKENKDESAAKVKVGVAEKQVKDAQDAHDNSDTGKHAKRKEKESNNFKKELLAAEKDLEEDSKTAVEEKTKKVDFIKKQLEEAKEKLEKVQAEINKKDIGDISIEELEAVDVMNKEIDALKTNLGEAEKAPLMVKGEGLGLKERRVERLKKEVTGAERRSKVASRVHKESSTTIKLEEAQTNLTNAKADLSIKAAAVKTKKAKIEEEEDRRIESYAKYIDEERGQIIPLLNPVSMYSHAQAEQTARDLRKSITTEEKKKEKEEKQWSKLLKKVTKRIEEEKEQADHGETPKEEKPKTDTHT